MAYKDVPAFMSKLCERDGFAPLALEFAILTAARSGEVYGALWSEIDLKAKVWTIPPKRMKAGRQQRVPLFKRTVEILARLFEAKPPNMYFPGIESGNL
jgi:integrase